MQGTKPALHNFKFHLVFLGIASFLFAHMAFAEVPASADRPEIEAGTGNIALPWQPAPPTPIFHDTSAVFIETIPSFSLNYSAEPMSVNIPGRITYQAVLKNTGNVPLTNIRISSTVPESFSGPMGDAGRPGILDINETWIFTGNYPVTQKVIDGNGVDDKNVPDNDGDINSTVTVRFAETPLPEKAAASVDVVRTPSFTVSKSADVSVVDGPGVITYTIAVKNTGNVSLTQISISDPLLEDLEGPEGDEINPGVLDVNETWTYSGKYEATQAVIDGNGVDANNVIDGDGDIDNIVMVDFAETDIPQAAYAPVLTDLSITGDIFEKKHRYVHGFLSATRLFTTNLYKTDRDPESCWATLITPGIWATFPSKMKRSVEIVTENAAPGGLAIEPFNPSHFQQFQAYILYSPQFERYHDQNLKAYQDPDLGAGMIDNDNIDQADDSVSRYTGQNSLNRLTHRVDTMLHYYSGNSLAVRAIDQYKISYDGFSERSYITDDKYTSNMFNLAGIFDPTDRLQLRLDYSKFCLNYEDDFNHDDDRTDNVYAAYLFFRLTSKTSAFLEYDFADINYDMSSRDSHEYRYFAGLRWEMTGKSSGQVKGGFGKKKRDGSRMIDTDADISDISENNWMAGIQIDHNITSKTNLTLNAYRRYDEVLEHRYDVGNLNDFYADYTLAHFAGLKLSWNVVSSIHLNLDTSLFYDKFINSRRLDREGIQTDRKDYEFAVSPSITIDLFKHFSINGAYIYTDHDSNYPEQDYFDHTVFVRASLFL